MERKTLSHRIADREIEKMMRKCDHRKPQNLRLCSDCREQARKNVVAFLRKAEATANELMG